MDVLKSLEFYMEMEETPEDTEAIHRTLKFAIAAGDALEGAGLEEKRDFICPCCNGKATAVHRIHGHGTATAVSARCSQCGMLIFS